MLAPQQGPRIVRANTALQSCYYILFTLNPEKYQQHWDYVCNRHWMWWMLNRLVLLGWWMTVGAVSMAMDERREGAVAKHLSGMR